MSEVPDVIDPSSGLSDSQRRRGLRFLALAVGAVGFALAVQIGLNANFLADEIGVSGFQMGLLEAIRESCGVVAFLLLALLAGLAEPIIGMLMLTVVAVGLGAYTFAPDFAWVIVMSLVWSQGLHIWFPLPGSMAMSLAEPDRVGYRLGQLGASNAIGFGAGLAVAFLLSLAGVAIRPMYLLAGAAALVAGAACLGIPRRIKVPGPRLVFRKRYALYYLLCLLEGWRKQIFLCFAGYLLVRVHGTRVEVMLLLMGIVQLISSLVSSRVGRLIDRVGERRILLLYYACLIVFFLGYATIGNKYVLYVLFVADHAMFVFAMAQTTYVSRIAPPAEHTATLSMGLAVHHVAAVAMPLVGGVLWATLGPYATFLAGALAAVVSIPIVLRLP